MYADANNEAQEVLSQHSSESDSWKVAKKSIVARRKIIADGAKGVTDENGELALSNIEQREDCFLRYLTFAIDTCKVEQITWMKIFDDAFSAAKENDPCSVQAVFDLFTSKERKLIKDYELSPIIQGKALVAMREVAAQAHKL